MEQTLNESYRMNLINECLAKTKIAGKYSYRCVNVVEDKPSGECPGFTIHIEKIYRGRVVATGEGYITDEQLKDTIETIKHCIF